jgi:hypothetical protein
MTENQHPSSLSARVTQNVRATVQAEEKGTKLFLIRRIPMRGMAREWKRPEDDKAYDDLLVHEGFYAKTLLEKKPSVELAADIRELDEHLLPHFWRMNQLAEYYQNRYYQYQWAFILSAFFTTAFAAVNVFFFTQEWNTDIAGLGVQPTELLGLLTALISGVAAAVAFLDANQTPQKRWFKARAKAESLRSLYFLFLGRAKPFDLGTDRERVHKMRQRVIEVLREAPSQIARPAPTTTQPIPIPPTDQRKDPEGGL